MTKTVSAKIPDEMKAEIDRADINISDVLRSALNEELRERRRAELRSDSAALGERLGERVDPDDVTAAVRETRDEN